MGNGISATNQALMVTLLENLLIEPGMEQIPNSTWGLVSMTVTLDLSSCNKSLSSLLRINQPNSNLSLSCTHLHTYSMIILTSY